MTSTCQTCGGTGRYVQRIEVDFATHGHFYEHLTRVCVACAVQRDERKSPPERPDRSTVALAARSECRELSDEDLGLYLTQFRRAVLMADDDEMTDWIAEWHRVRLVAAEAEWGWRKRAERHGGPAVQRQKAQERLEDLKARVDLVELVSARVKLRRSGSEYVGLCPFHTEKTPSFYVNPEKQVYLCRGCQAGGDVVTWVERVETTGEFRDALRWLEQHAA